MPTGNVRSMRVAVASDHAGITLRGLVAQHLRELGHHVVDLGCDPADGSVDYPDMGEAVGRAVARGGADLGVAVCATGLGISMAANKVPGVRAARVDDPTSARLAREHNHANVLCLGERTTGALVALESLDAWLSACELGGRHQRRVDKLAALDGAAVGSR